MSAPTAPAPRPVRHRSRPMTDYWDIATASWQTRRPAVPEPRRGG
jgi:hypothetical protein